MLLIEKSFFLQNQSIKKKNLQRLSFPPPSFLFISYRAPHPHPPVVEKKLKSVYLLLLAFTASQNKVKR